METEALRRNLIMIRILSTTFTLLPVMRSAFREAALLGHSPIPYSSACKAHQTISPLNAPSEFNSYSCLQQSFHFLDRVSLIYLFIILFHLLFFNCFLFLNVFNIAVITGKIKTVLTLKTQCIDWTATRLHTHLSVLYIVYIRNLPIVLRFFICLFYLFFTVCVHAVVLCTESFFCHQNKFLVCLNKPGIKSHFECDIKFKCNFAFVLQVTAQIYLRCTQNSSTSTA